MSQDAVIWLAVVILLMQAMIGLQEVRIRLLRRRMANLEHLVDIHLKHQHEQSRDFIREFAKLNGVPMPFPEEEENV